MLSNIENTEMTLHRIRLGLISFKELVKPVLKNNAMSYEQFEELNLAAQVSNDYNDSLTLNKLTVLFAIGA